MQRFGEHDSLLSRAAPVAPAGVMIEGTTSPPILELMDLAEENTKEYAPQLTIARSTNSFGAIRKLSCPLVCLALFWLETLRANFSNSGGAGSLLPFVSEPCTPCQCCLVHLTAFSLTRFG